MTGAHGLPQILTCWKICSCPKLQNLRQKNLTFLTDLKTKLKFEAVMHMSFENFTAVYRKIAIFASDLFNAR